ncbi:penicillin-binding protein 1A [Desulfurispira natronophila]|uniref:peptidoglycan glycosyltransferase n=1 Tax=Desulfurispira natronophila TaxID=682562 RepID=A0A7W7Y4L1_9BACT|nr:PBP1A family penicillin-binding protein [Desulfurispira natronophila]MBB5021702.1 penicillin-binding protein 1A [Desulfurispira natronophila]
MTDTQTGNTPTDPLEHLPKPRTPRPRRGALAMIGKIMLFLFLSVFLFGAGGLSYGLYYFYKGLPDFSELENFEPGSITRVYDRNDEIIAEFFLEKRIPVSIEDLPEYVYMSVVAVEDTTFFEHQGLDFQGIMRAFIANMQAGRIVEGGSTITQQLAKTMFLTPERNITRKIREALLAYKIDRTLDKMKILELYMNQVYFGRGAYGIEAAAQNFFDISASDLSISQAALLAGMPQAPSRYGRDIHAQITRNRHLHTLGRMREDRVITESQYDDAVNEQLEITGHHRQLNKAPYVNDMVRNYLLENYGADAIYHQGLNVYTTIDINAQLEAQQAITKGLDAYVGRHPNGLPHETPPEDLQFSLISVDNNDGSILALVGGTNFYTSQFNRATNGFRQSGSAFKPFIFSAAIDQGYTAASIIIDSPLIFSSDELVWKPENYSERFYGPTTLREALAKSRNIVTVKLLREVGVRHAIDFSRRLGISSPISEDLSIALGSTSVSLWEITRAYATFPSQGRLHHMHYISRIENRHGNILEEFQPAYEQVITEQDAYIMTSMLQTAVEDGTGFRARALERPTGGKTGSTNNFVDAWFIGFTPEVTTGVWAGFDTPRTMGNHETGSRTAAPVWVDFMQQYMSDKPVRNFTTPENLVYRLVDPYTGKLARSREGAVYEVFLAGTEPTEYSGPSERQTIDDMYRLRGGGQ